MKHSSAYFPLSWRVDVRWPGNAYFEVIAAFNCREAAEAYAKGCAFDKRPMQGVAWTYRVMERTGSRSEWKERVSYERTI